MGRYMIVIVGSGVHHNAGRNQKDADLMALQLVEDMRAAGHSIEMATFSSGHGHHDLDVPREEHLHRVGNKLTVPVSPEIAALARMNQVSNPPSSGATAATVPGSVARPIPTPAESLASVPGSVAQGGHPASAPPPQPPPDSRAD